MRLTLVRNATLLVELGSRRILVEPMLDPAGARPPVEGSPSPRSNPLVPLPLPAEEAVAGLGAVIVTHLHRDHFDEAGARLIPARRPARDDGRAGSRGGRSRADGGGRPPGRRSTTAWRPGRRCAPPSPRR